MAKCDMATDIGLVRPVNEDSLACIAPEVYVIADGMGGAAAGEVASSLLVNEARLRVQEALAKEERMNEKVLKDIILRANAVIRQSAREHYERRGMGTTATILALDGGHGFFAHVGDSRLYRLRRGDFRQVTEDHSYVADLVRRGVISKDLAKNHPKKNYLLRAVGVYDALEVDTGQVDIASGDVFLLSTDGLTNMVSEESIATILRSDFPHKASLLVEAALDSGGTDNVSAIVVECGDDGR